MQCFSTVGIPPRRKIGFWNEVAGDALTEMEICPRAPIPFDGTLYRDNLGPLGIGRASSTPTQIARTGAHIARARERLFLLNLCNRGRFGLAQGGREATVEEGDFTISDTAEPFVMCHHTSCEAVVLRVPERLLKDHIPRAELLAGRVISARQGLGAVASAMIRSLGQQVSTGLNLPEDSTIPTSMLQIIAAACASLPGIQVSDTAATSGRRIQIRRFIEIELRNPDLTAGAISAAFGISDRYVRAIFAPHGETVSSYILRRRLEECARRLRDPLWSAHTISDIAFEWGFNSLGTFSRAFKAHYGLTPHEYRGGTA